METFNILLHHLHNVLRWALLLSGLWAIILAYNGLSKKRNWEIKDQKAGMWLILFCHIQLLIGLTLYIYLGQYSIFSNMANGMKDPEIRYWGMEHLLSMIIAVAVIQYGRIATRKATNDLVKHKKAAIWFTVGILIMLSNIPWPWREIGRSLFPGM